MTKKIRTAKEEALRTFIGSAVLFLPFWIWGDFNLYSAIMTAMAIITVLGYPVFRVMHEKSVIRKHEFEKIRSKAN